MKNCVHERMKEQKEDVRKLMALAEYRSPWEEASDTLDMTRFEGTYKVYKAEDLTEAGKTERLKSITVKNEA